MIYSKGLIWGRFYQGVSRVREINKDGKVPETKNRGKLLPCLGLKEPGVGSSVTRT